MDFRLALLAMAKMSDNRVTKEDRDRIKSYADRKAAHERAQKAKKRSNRIIVGSISGIFAIALGIGVFSAIVSISSPGPETSPTPSATIDLSPDAALSEYRTWTGAMDVAGVPLTFELTGEAAPKAVASTISLIGSGFYEGISCHRLTTEGIFVLQCGDPTGDGTGGPGYSYGPVENAPADNVYPAGTIAMARQGGNGNSMGSQFFLVYEDSTIPSDAAGGYTVIGHITSGLPELIAQVTSQGTANGSSDGAPKIPVTITGATVK
jgi:peptidyl-prolyl cis-trans isomerase B (cyclophilin B)